MKRLTINYQISRKLRVTLLALMLFIGSRDALCVRESDQVVIPTNAITSLLDSNGVGAGKIYDTFANALKNIGTLDYFKDSKIAFDFMGNEISFDWGFVGSGDIFKPLETINPKFGEDRSGKISATSVVTTIALKQLKHLREQGSTAIFAGKDSNFQWLINTLIDFKLTPLNLFCLKLALLVKSFATEQDVSYLFEEVACLLFRLSLVDDLSIAGKSLDKSKPLTSYLPKSLNELLNEVGSGFGLSSFVDHIWSTIVCNKMMPDELALKKPITVYGFMFTNGASARLAYEHFKDYAKHDFCQAFEVFGKNEGKFQIVDEASFGKLGSEITAEDLDEIDPFAANQVGYKEFNLDNNAFVSGSLEEQILRQVKLLDGKEGVIYFEAKDKKQFWVAQVSQAIGVVGVVKSLVLTFAKTFKDYINVKKSLYEGQDQASKEYRAAVNKHETLQKKLEAFVRSVDGKPVFEDLCKQVGVVVGAGLGDKAIKELRNRQAELEKEIATLEASKAAKLQLKANYDRTIALGGGRSNSALVEESSKLLSETNDLTAQISAKRQEMCGCAAEASVADASILQDKQKLERLKNIVKDKQAANAEVDKRIIAKIQELEQRVANSAKHIECKAKLEDRLAVCVKIADIFEQKASELHEAFKQKRLEVEKIADADERTIQELFLEDSELLANSFISRLESAAKEIRSNNDKAKKLETLRRIIASDQGKQLCEATKELDVLELEVGHILDGKSHENFIHNLMMRSSIFKDFIKDMVTTGDSDTKMMGLKQGITESVKQIIDGSETVQDNIIVLRYLMQFMPSSLKAILRVSGAAQLVGA